MTAVVDTWSDFIDENLIARHETLDSHYSRVVKVIHDCLNHMAELICQEVTQ